MGLIGAFMLVTQAPFIQGKTYYPDMSTCYSVAQSISDSSMGLHAQCEFTRIPRVKIPRGVKIAAFILVTNAPLRGMQSFYPDIASCQAVMHSVEYSPSHPKAACYPVRVPEGYISKSD